MAFDFLWERPRYEYARGSYFEQLQVRVLQYLAIGAVDDRGPRVVAVVETLDGDLFQAGLETLKRLPEGEWGYR